MSREHGARGRPTAHAFAYVKPVEMYQPILVSDGCGPFKYKPSVPSNLLNHMIRAWRSNR